MTRKAIFHEDWWLEALAPGNWREVTCGGGGNVSGYLRFVERREFGMKICEMPKITRFLGPVVLNKPEKVEARNRSARSIVAELLAAIDGYAHVQMTLDTEFNDLTPFLAAGFSVSVHPTLLLDCRQPIEKLWSGLRDKARNVIRRARDSLAIKDITDVRQFAQFYQDNLDGDQSYFDLSLLIPAFSAAHARNQCRIVAAADPAGATHAMVLFIWDDKYVHYFMSTRDKRVAHAGAVSLLLWTGIEFAHGKGLHFDFDGGLEEESRFKFMQAFGGDLANRYEVRRTTAAFQAQRQVRRILRAVVRRITAISEKVSGNVRVRRQFSLVTAATGFRRSDDGAADAVDRWPVPSVSSDLSRSMTAGVLEGPAARWPT